MGLLDSVIGAVAGGMGGQGRGDAQGALLNAVIAMLANGQGQGGAGGGGLGDLIGKTDKSSKRNELIIFITPQIVQDAGDASTVSQELRAKMKSFNWN